MADFLGLGIQDEYRSGRNDVLAEFLRPALSCATRYWRSVGYFSSSAFEAIGAPVSSFVRHGGRMRLITSVELREKDYEAMKDGHSKRQICEKRILEIIEGTFSSNIDDGALALLHLISIGRLELKVAVPKKGKGIYHEKLGLLWDGTGNCIAFTGSMNESRSAFEENFECVDVFKSWETEKRVNAKIENFDLLWDGKDPAAETFEFPEAAKNELIRIYEASASGDGGERKSDEIDWSHQEKALQEFLKKKNGILAMATGTGKTRTALNILEKLFNDGYIRSAIICTDGNDLLAQWVKNIFPFLSRLSEKISLFKQFDDYKELNRYLIHPENSVIICSRQNLSKILNKLPESLNDETLIVLDEVHGIGSPALREQLSKVKHGFRWKLGLSATPRREYDEEGNQFIEDFVGEPIFEFSLEDAISAGILCPFDYFPIEYDLTDNDTARLQQVYKRQAARAREGRPMSDEEVWRELARVYKTAEMKPYLLDRFLTNHPDALKRSMVFVETMEYGMQVAEVIHRHRRDYHTYFSGTDSEVLRRFSNGELDILISCHRLSEGVDIQSTSAVILVSSDRGQRETIQRIGRCLRRDPENPEKRAIVVDFIRSSDSPEGNPDIARSDWLSKVSKTRRKA